MSSKYPKKAQIKIGTNQYEVDGIYESELGYLMVRLFNIETKSFLTYNLGPYDMRDNLIVNQIRKNEIYRNDM